LNDITLGQFVAGNSAIHRLDPRTKLILMIAYIVMTFLVKSMVMYLLPFAFVLLTLVLSKISPSYIWKSLKPLRFLIVFMFVINLFVIKGDTVLFEWWILRITKEGIVQAVFVTLRLVLLVSGTSLLTLTTSPISLTDGIEKLLSPLKVVRFPAHELAMMMTIALRFIPTLMDEAVKIQKAQLARGADFESGNIIKRAKAMIPVLIPLFVSAFRRADELAMAMESRCYHGGDGRTRMRSLKLGWNDLAATLITGAFITAIALMEHFIDFSF